MLCRAELVDLLQVQPELGTGTEVVPQTQRRVPGDRALSVEDMGDPIGWHLSCRTSLAALICRG